MSVLKFSHPKLRNVEMNFGQMTQVVGDNSEMKQQLWQNILWYLNNHKYTEFELDSLDYNEPIIYENNEIMSRNKFKPIIIESMADLNELLSVKKGTPIFDFLGDIMINTEITKNIESINLQLENIMDKMNSDKKIKKLNERQIIKWQSFIEEINIQSLLQKNISIASKFNDNNYAVEYIDGYSKYKLLLDILNSNLSNNSTPILLMIKNIDDSLHYNEYKKIMINLEELVLKNPNFYCIVFPSQIGYVHVTEEYGDNILIMGNEAYSLSKIELLYDRVEKYYPSNSIPTYKKFLEYLEIIIPYLFTNKKQSVKMSIKEMILIKIINELYQYYEYIPNEIDKYSELEYDYLFN